MRTSFLELSPDLHSPQLEVRYGIESIPAVKVFKDGQVVREHVGLADKARLKAMLDI
jgi:thioredoxin-like negative regulator of GroEL